MFMRLLIPLWFFSIGTAVFSQDLSDWCGHYAGNLYILSANGQLTGVPMELKISSADSGSYHWTLVYGADSTADVREYLLLPPVNGRYTLDERNGIFLSMTKFADEMICVFEVSGAIVWISYALTKKGLDIKITSSATPELSGGITSGEGEEIPLITSYETSVCQYASLKKRK